MAWGSGVMSRVPGPKLSVTVITYNQANYIGFCLDSILSQVVDFQYEIIIGDDASTDGTLEIIKEYCERHSNIYLINHERNIGLNLNYLSVLKACNGEYIAHIDGDDMMLPGKLKKQVDVLDVKSDIAIVHHPVLFIDMNNNEVGRSNCGYKTVETINDLCVENKINNCSNMYRASAMDDTFYNIPPDLVFHDWYFHLLKAQYGDIYYINEYLGSYRKYPESVINSSRRQRVLKSEIYTLEKARNLMNVSARCVFIGYSKVYLRQVRHYLRNKQLHKAGYFLRKVRSSYPYSYSFVRYSIKWCVYNLMRKYCCR